MQKVLENMTANVFTVPNTLPWGTGREHLAKGRELCDGAPPQSLITPFFLHEVPTCPILKYVQHSTDQLKVMWTSSCMSYFMYRPHLSN